MECVGDMNVDKKTFVAKGRGFRRLLPLMATAALMMGAPQGARSETGAKAEIIMDSGHAEDKWGTNSVDDSRQTARFGLSMRTDKDFFVEVVPYVSRARRNAHGELGGSFITGDTVLQQSISTMGNGDTLALAPMSLKLISITRDTTIYQAWVAKFDVTDTGTGETSTCYNVIGKPNRVYWKSKAYRITTEAQDLVSASKTLYVTFAQVEENRSEGTQFDASVVDEAVGAEIALGWLQGSTGIRTSLFFESIARRTQTQILLNEYAPLSRAYDEKKENVGVGFSIFRKNLTVDAMISKERAAAEIEMRFGTYATSLGYNREELDAGSSGIGNTEVKFIGERAMATVTRNVMKTADSSADIGLWGGRERYRVSLKGTIQDAEMLKEANGYIDVKSVPFGARFKVKKGALEGRCDLSMPTNNMPIMANGRIIYRW